MRIWMQVWCYRTRRRAPSRPPPDTRADFGQGGDGFQVRGGRHQRRNTNPPTPTGTVQFSIDGSPYGTPVDLVDGVASISDADLPVGSHTISAAYTPDSPDFVADSSQEPKPLAVEADATSTTVTTAPDTLADFGQKATFTVAVENIGDNAAPDHARRRPGRCNSPSTGDPYPVRRWICSTVWRASATRTLPVGSHTISAAYTPDSPDFAAGSSEAAPLVIQADATSTTVTTAPDTLADFGQSVTFTATVENISDSADPATPTGTAQFTVDGSPYGAPGGSGSTAWRAVQRRGPARGLAHDRAPLHPGQPGLRCRQFPGARTPGDPGGTDVHHRHHVAGHPRSEQ